jgi:light-regulated signal transduction histidine kinase (bacteriophytochrome)
LEALDDHAERRLEELLAGLPAFSFALTRVAELADSAVLVLEPEVPFRALTRVLWEDDRFGRISELIELPSTQVRVLVEVPAGHSASGQIYWQPLEHLPGARSETVERLTPLSERSGVRLETGDLPEVHILGDRQYLVQMLSNLVENGIKYTDGAERQVKVETGRQDGTAWVRVSDSGPGIPAEHLAHLFDRFYRVDASRTRSPEDGGAAGVPNTAPGGSPTGAPGGSGLGLSIVQWIAREHGGEVRVASEVGKGTMFEARFRAVE